MEFRIERGRRCILFKHVIRLEKLPNIKNETYGTTLDIKKILCEYK